MWITRDKYFHILNTNNARMTSFAWISKTSRGPEDGLSWPKLVAHTCYSIQDYKLCQTAINIFYWLLTITQRDALYKKLLDAVWFCYRRHASCFNMLVFPQSKDQFFRWRYLKCLTERTTDVTFSGIAECFSASWCKTSLSWPNMSRKRRNI